MNILLSNDDGIHAPGLWAAAEQLSKVGNVTVVAPDREQSGVGTSVTFHRPLRVKPQTSPVRGVKAFSIEGTPADSIILALKLPLLDTPPDVVVSGINEGANLGEDVYISGTVGAALRGYFEGISAVSISVGSRTVSDFTAAARLAGLAVSRLADGLAPGRMLLNINLPDVPLGQIRDMKVTRLAHRIYCDEVREDGNTRHKCYWIGRQKARDECVEGTDHWAVRGNMISLTPLMAEPLLPVVSFVREAVSGLMADLCERSGVK